MLERLIVLFIIGLLFIPFLTTGLVLYSVILALTIALVILLVKTGILSNITRSIKARKIENKEVLLEIDIDRKLAVFSHFNEQKDQVLVVSPQLTQDGDLEYIRSWHDLLNVLVHGLEEINDQYQNFDIMKQLVAPIREHLQIEQDISQLEQQEEKIEQLLNLVSSSEFYSSQEELYKRALSQVQQMIEKASKLEQVYVRLIREVLIGKELSGYDPNQILDNHMAVDSQYKKIKEEYQQLKDTATAYSELLQNEKF